MSSPEAGSVPITIALSPASPASFFPSVFSPRSFAGCFWRRCSSYFVKATLQLTGSLASLNDVNVFLRYLQPLHESDWVVYAKPPFGGPHQVLEYLGRYTHRVAISNHRLVSLENGQVTFRWKDYRHEQRQRTMTLPVDEFIRRFLIHSLPAGFQRIRSGGFLANRHRKGKLTLLRQLLHQPVSELLPLPQQCAELLALLTGQPKDQCPNCLIGRMRCVELLSPLRRSSAAPGASLDSS